MEKEFINLTQENIDQEHICCAISDKKCKDGYEKKKEWLKKELDNGYVFRRINERAKVFVEYGPAENAWVPVEAPNYLMLNCFWVSGQYKGKGYAKELLQFVVDDAIKMNKQGLVTVAGATKFHFMSDTKWLLRQGFEIIQKLPHGFVLLARKLEPTAPTPQFKNTVLTGTCPEKKGVVVYYSNRCPFTEYHVHQSLVETTKKRNLPLTIIKLETMEQAQTAPTPATIFSLFYNGQFVTTDISVCMDSRFDKVLSKVEL